MQKKSPKRFILVSTIILILGIGWIGMSATFPGGVSVQGIPAPQEGFLAPDFTSETLTGEMIELSELNGHPVLINFWASWCRPCQSEMPAIERVYKEYVNKGFTILAVNTTYQDNPADVAVFVSDYNLSFPILLDINGTVSGQYELRALPSSFFVGRDGIIQEIIFGGPIAESLLRLQVEKLLEEIP
jgi:thiol-disulfide isomerase/thioredoxin